MLEISTTNQTAQFCSVLNYRLHCFDISDGMQIKHGCWIVKCNCISELLSSWYESCRRRLILFSRESV